MTPTTLWLLAGLALVAWAMFGVLLFARDAKVAPEVPPAEERPYIPEPWHLQYREVEIVTPDRPLPNEHWKGKTIDRICWELSEGVTP
jgi:hypothetical protein